MKNKMTAKEFKEILDRCGLDNSYENCLCRMAKYYYDESKRAKEQGYDYTARWYGVIFDTMLAELNKREFFD